MMLFFLAAERAKVAHLQKRCADVQTADHTFICPTDEQRDYRHDVRVDGISASDVKPVLLALTDLLQLWPYLADGKSP